MGDAEVEDQAPAASLVSQVVPTRGGQRCPGSNRAKCNNPGVVYTKKQKAFLSMFSNRPRIEIRAQGVVRNDERNYAAVAQSSCTLVIGWPCVH